MIVDERDCRRSDDEGEKKGWTGECDWVGRILYVFQRIPCPNIGDRNRLCIVSLFNVHVKANWGTPANKTVSVHH